MLIKLYGCMDYITKEAEKNKKCHKINGIWNKEK